MCMIILNALFYGIAYQNKDTGKFAFLCNANEKTLYNKVKEMDQQGILHTPVYQRTYWYNRSTDLPNIRKRFDTDLRTVMNEAYLERIMTLQNLSSAISPVLWEQCLQRVEQTGLETAVEGLRYWGRRWNVI